MAKYVKLPLVEREEILEEIEKAVREVWHENRELMITKCRVINIYGNGGYGKSYLTDFCKEKYAGNSRVIFYDFSRNEDRGSEDIILSWAKCILEKNKKYRFDLFALAYNKYQELAGNDKKAQLKKNILDSLGIKILVAAAGAVIGAISLGFGVAAAVAGEALGDVEAIESVKKWFQGNRSLVKQINSCKSEEEIRNLMTICFVKDMERNVERNEDGKVQPLIFFLDTYEAYSRKNNQYKHYEDEWLKNMIAQLDNVVWVILGRQKLTWEELTVNRYMQVLEIEKDSSFQRIFEDEAIQITEPSHCNYIKKHSKGYPELLKNYVHEYLFMAEKNEICLEKLTGNVEAVAERICSGLDTSARILLQILSILKWWPDESIVKEILPEFPETNVLELGKIQTFHLINKNEVEEGISQCMKTSADNSIWERVLAVLHKNMSEDTEYAHYYATRYQEVSLDYYCKTEDRQCGTELLANLVQLNEKIVDDPLSFEKQFLPIWEKLEDTNHNEIWAYALALYRKYLKKCKLLEEADAFFTDIKIEEDLRRGLKKQRELALDMIEIYVDGCEKEPYSEALKMDLEKEYPEDKSIAYYYSILKFFKADKYDELERYYENYQKEGKTEDCCYYRILMLYIGNRMLRGKYEEVIEISENAYEILKESNKELAARLQDWMIANIEDDPNRTLKMAQENYEHLRDIYGSDRYMPVMEARHKITFPLEQSREIESFQESAKIQEEILTLMDEIGDVQSATYIGWKISLASTYYTLEKYKEAMKILENIKPKVLAYEGSMYTRCHQIERFVRTYWFVKDAAGELKRGDLARYYKWLLEASRCGEVYYRGESPFLYAVYGMIYKLGIILEKPEEEINPYFLKALRLTKAYYGEDSTEYQTIFRIPSDITYVD